MTIRDAMHAANEEITAPFAETLARTTAREIDGHTVEAWDAAYTHVAVMVRNGWSAEEAARAASGKFSVPMRPLHVLIVSEMATFGQAQS